MTHYCDSPSHVQLEVFKPSGKWYTTIELEWVSYDCPNIHRAFKESIEANRVANKLWNETDTDWIFVCLEPYHEHAHPLMMKRSNINAYSW